MDVQDWLLKGISEKDTKVSREFEDVTNGLETNVEKIFT